MGIDREEFLFKKPRSYHQTLVRLYAFADVYDTAQLRKDIMTLLVELTLFNNDNRDLVDSWLCLPVIEDLYGSLPSSSPMCKFAVKSAAVHSRLDAMEKSSLEKLPQAHLTDIIQASLPLERDLRSELEEELHDSCKFHEHHNEYTTEACKTKQHRDSAFCTGFLRACISEVYDIEHAEAAAELQAMNDAVQLEAEKKAKAEAEKKARIKAKRKVKLEAEKKAELDARIQRMEQYEEFFDCETWNVNRGRRRSC